MNWIDLGSKWNVCTTLFRSPLYIVCCACSGDLKSRHLKTGIFKIKFQVVWFQRVQLQLKHSKSGCFCSISNVLWQMAAICMYFKWPDFRSHWNSQPLHNNLFFTLQTLDYFSKFQDSTFNGPEREQWWLSRDRNWSRCRFPKLGLKFGPTFSAWRSYLWINRRLLQQVFIFPYRQLFLSSYLSLAVSYV